MPLEAVLTVVSAGAFGLLIGSFLNVCIYRLPRDLSIVRPRSHCPDCGKMVRAWDNIPVLSFFILGRKCRACRSPISWRYPLVEALTAILFAAFTARDGATFLTLRECVFSALLVALIFTDLETRLLPESLTVGGIALGLAFALLTPVGDGTVAALTAFTGRLASLGDSLAGALIPAGVLWSVGWIFEKVRHKQGLGLGDVIMLAETGAFLGIRAALLTLVAASLAGSVAGLAYILMKRENPGTYELPLGSFLGAAAIFVMLFGAGLIRWYLSLLA